MTMNTNLLKAVIAYAGKTQGEVAHTLGMTPQNFGQRLNRNTFSDEELMKIAEILGAEFQPAAFVFPDGRKF